MTTLGAMLRKQHAMRETVNLAERRLRDEEVERQERVRRDKVREWFMRRRDTIITKIEHSQELEPFKLPPDIAAHPTNASMRIVTPGHPDHDIYLEFANWLAENELACRFEFDLAEPRMIIEPAPEPTAPVA